MSNMELLAPAGNYEAAIAAVQNGANAIYLGFGAFNARRNAKNFSEEEMESIVTYCRVRGVKTHVTLNTLMTDRELHEVEDTIRYLNRIGTDAVIVADLGLARRISQVAPEMEIHASTQLTIHSLAGAQFVALNGFSRVVLSRELPAEEISYISKNTTIETEVFVHGALCMCYSGQCYMSGVIGKRSGNRGLCAQPCRLPYRVDDAQADTYPLSLKDLCLADYLEELRAMGVSSLKIEGRMKRPEYVAVVCGIYAQLLKERRRPTKEERAMLTHIFSREGFTDGYYKNLHGSAMFGVRRGCEETHLDEIYASARHSYEGEKSRIPLYFKCKIQKDKPIWLHVQDEDGHEYAATGINVETAVRRALDLETVREKLSKTGGTPFYCKDITICIENDVMVPVSAINAVRRECLEKIVSLRSMPPCRKEGMAVNAPKVQNKMVSPEITVCVRDIGQICDDLCDLKPRMIFIPIKNAVLQKDKLQKYLKKAPIGVMIPQIVWDTQWEETLEYLLCMNEIGIHDALVSNVGVINPVKMLEFNVHGDLGLNVFNSETLMILSQAGLTSATLSSELTFPQIRDISKGIDTSLVAYGRLPLMVTENCAVTSRGKCKGCKSHVLVDRKGKRFPVMCEENHRNKIYNSEVIWLADKKADYSRLGVKNIRLLFTDESAEQCVRVLQAYQYGEGSPPSSFTRGLYYRGVE